jgi:hypothetical protein
VEYETYDALISELDWNGAFAELLSREVEDARGNIITMCGGYASQNHKKDNNDGVTTPQPTKSVNQWLV